MRSGSTVLRVPPAGSTGPARGYSWTPAPASSRLPGVRLPAELVHANAEGDRLARLDVRDREVLGRGPVTIDPPNDWDRMLDTKVCGLLNVTAAVLPAMVARGSGHVINIGSNAGREVYRGGAVYCATRPRSSGSHGAPGGDAEVADAVCRGLKPLNGEHVAEFLIYPLDRAGSGWLARREP